MAEEKFFFNLSQFNHDAREYALREIREELQLFYAAGDIAWVLTSSVLVFLMSVGIALFYSGLVKPSNNLYMGLLPLMAGSVAAIEWYLWGYSWAFGEPNASVFWGGKNGAGIALHDTLLRPTPWSKSPGRGGGPDTSFVPEIVYVLFEGMFASFTAALIAAAAAYKERPGHFLIFILLWVPLVYVPIARWTWSPEGYFRSKGVLDFAGGGAVHICSGATALAHAVYYEFILEKWESRVLTPAAIAIKVAPKEHEHQERNGERVTSSQCFQGTEKPPYTDMSRIMLGTALLWVGWFGFNGGSALGANVRGASACVSTHLAACTGAVTNVLFMMLLQLVAPRFTARWITRRSVDVAAATDHDEPVDDDDDNADGNGDDENNININRNNADVVLSPFMFNPIDFCNGAVVGLVAITPAAGFVPHWISPFFGIAANILVVPMMPLSHLVNDKLLVFVIHAGAGFWGMIFTGVFAKGDVAALDGYTVAEDYMGPLDGAKYGDRVGWQLAGALAALGWAFTMTLGTLLLLEIPMFFIGRKRMPRWSGRVAVNDDKIVDMDVLSGI